jgi:hypothetical protein
VVNVKILSFAQHLASVDEFNDPASWGSASYLDDPIDKIEPLLFGPNPYRERALGCLAVVKAIDQFMSQASNSRLAWIGISLGLGLDSTRGLTVTELARHLECSEQTINASATRFLKLSGLPPADGKFAPWV